MATGRPPPGFLPHARAETKVPSQVSAGPRGRQAPAKFPDPPCIWPGPPPGPPAAMASVRAAGPVACRLALSTNRARAH